MVQIKRTESRVVQIYILFVKEPKTENHLLINKYKFIFVKHFQFFYFETRDFLLFDILKYKQVKDPLEAVLVAVLHGLHFAYELGFEGLF